VKFVALIGLPGAGKSTVARAIAQAKGWPIVDRDDLPRASFDESGKAAATDAALAQVARHLTRNQSCILDGMTLSSRAQRDRLRALARQHNAELVLLWLDCPVEIAVARVAAQSGHSALDRDAVLVRDVASRFEQPEADVLRLDAQLPTKELVGRAMRALDLEEL
jgi:predicted kinase